MRRITFKVISVTIPTIRLHLIQMGSTDKSFLNISTGDITSGLHQEGPRPLEGVDHSFSLFSVFKSTSGRLWALCVVRSEVGGQGTYTCRVGKEALEGDLLLDVQEEGTAAQHHALQDVQGHLLDGGVRNLSIHLAGNLQAERGEREREREEREREERERQGHRERERERDVRKQKERERGREREREREM